MWWLPVMWKWRGSAWHHADRSGYQSADPGKPRSKKTGHAQRSINRNKNSVFLISILTTTLVINKISLKHLKSLKTNQQAVYLFMLPGCVELLSLGKHGVNFLLHLPHKILNQNLMSTHGKQCACARTKTIRILGQHVTGSAHAQEQNQLGS